MPPLSFICCLCSRVHCEHPDRHCPVSFEVHRQWAYLSDRIPYVPYVVKDGYLEITKAASLVLRQTDDSPQNINETE